MKNTHSCFDINEIRELGNKQIVKFTISEGYFDTIEGEETFIRETILNTSNIVFNYYPVLHSDIEYALRDITKQYSSLPLCF